jgi:hypothetical protein
MKPKMVFIQNAPPHRASTNAHQIGNATHFKNGRNGANSRSLRASSASLILVTSTSKLGTVEAYTK